MGYSTTHAHFLEGFPGLIIPAAVQATQATQHRRLCHFHTGLAHVVIWPTFMAMALSSVGG
jgi:hypothetical protein